MAEAGNNHQNSNEGQQNTSTLPPTFYRHADYLMIRNDIEFSASFPLALRLVLIREMGEQGGPWAMSMGRDRMEMGG